MTGYEESEMWKVFDDAAEEVISRRDFEKWLVALGAFRNKPELQDTTAVKEIARVCEEVLGCQTGIEYMLLQEAGLGAAGVKVMTARIIVRAAQPQPERPEQSLGQSAHSSGESHKSAADTVAEMVAESMVESAKQSAQGVKEATERKALKKLTATAGACLLMLKQTLKWIEEMETDRANYDRAWSKGVNVLRTCPQVQKID